MFRNYFDPDQSENRVIIVCIAVSLILFFLNFFLPFGVAGGVLYIITVLLALWSRNLNMPIYIAILGSLLAIVGIFTSSDEGDFGKAVINLMLALGAIWVVALVGVRFRKVQEAKKRAFLEVKRLTGLLPICSSCKKIREDERYWDHIESYIHGHSEVEVGHGICPECEKKMYPEEDAEIL